MRFSTVAGERGAADAERDIRGFAVKFYTEEGNWDLVGNNTPVFFIRDPLQFPDLNRAVKRNPKTNLRDATANWDFWTSLPEAIPPSDNSLWVTVVFLNLTVQCMVSVAIHTVLSMKTMNAYGLNSTGFANNRLKISPMLEAAEIVANDRESHQRDLFDAIERGDFPKWKLCIQVMTEEQANNMPYNPFDLTKVWYHDEFPLIEVGVMELNRNPENYFQDVEQAAFAPSTIIPGVSFSPDRMLQVVCSPMPMHNAIV